MLVPGMTEEEKIKIVRNYYEEFGEKVGMVKKLTQTVYKGTKAEHKVESFLCHVKRTEKKPWATLCVIAFDSNLKPYAVEIDYEPHEKEQEMIDRWKERVNESYGNREE